MAAIFGRRAEQLSGWPIQALMPALPLQPATPGYNLAFATFWHLDASRRPLWGVDNKGDRVALDVDIQRFGRESVTALAPQIRLTLRSRAVAGRAERGVADLERYLHAVTSCADGVVVTDARQSIVGVNPSAERMIGRPSEQLRGVTLTQVLAAATGAIPRSKTPSVWKLAGGGGTCTHVESTTRPFVDRFGVVTHEVHTLRDFAEQAGASAPHERMTCDDSLTGRHDRIAAASPLPSCASADRSGQTLPHDPLLALDSPAGGLAVARWPRPRRPEQPASAEEFAHVS